MAEQLVAPAQEVQPTDAMSKLQEINNNIAAQSQAKADKERLDTWIGEVDESAPESAESMMDYLNSRPTNEAEAVSAQVANEASLNNQDGEYAPSTQEDKDLAYLTSEFEKLDSLENLEAALDLLSDYCNTYNISRNDEKQLRKHLMASVGTGAKEAQTATDDVTPATPDAVADTSNQPVASVADEQEPLAPASAVANTVVAAKVQTPAPAPTVVEASAQPEAKDSIDTDVSHFRVQYDEESTGKTIKGTMVGINRLNGKYVIKLDDGRSVELMTEDFVTMAEEDDNIDDTSSGGTSEPEQAPATEEPKDELSKSDAAQAKVLAAGLTLTEKIKEAKASWNELPRYKKLIIGIGSAAIAGLGVVIAYKYNVSSDAVVIPDVNTDAVPVPEASAPLPDTSTSEPVLLGGNESGSALESTDVGNGSLTGAQEQFVNSNAQYPYDAAHAVYGDRAADALKAAAEAAKANGVNIETVGEGANWGIKVNGSFNAQEVNKVLAEYMPKQ